MSGMEKTYRKETSEDIKRMQQDAIKRVREMQKRAKRTLEQSKSSSFKNMPSPQKDVPQENTCNQNFAKRHSEEKTTVHRKKNNINFINNLPNLVEPLFKDKEKSLILILILILMGEKDENNFEIILVLFYILYV